MASFKHIVNIVPLTRVSLDASQIFTYLVPLRYQGLLRPGQLVRVPFGRRLTHGIVSSAEAHRLAQEVKGLKAVDEILEKTPLISEQNLRLAEFISQHYVSPLGLVVKAMLPKFIKRPKVPVLVGYEMHNPDFILTEPQKQAVVAISSALNKAKTFLLHGVTGSGKTEVYLRVMERLMAAGRQIIMLVPEISLTPQAIGRFARRFGIEKIAVLHSQLRASERYYTWQKIRDGEKQIIIGPRSAVFAPVSNLGLIVIDEEHDSSYKQYDQNPKYHAVTVAKKLSEIWQVPIVLGDATPSVESFYEIGTSKATLLTLPHRIKADVGMPRVKIIDLREEIKAGNFSIFSEVLKAEILHNLKLNKQIILFLNRRGAATHVLCRDCGYVLTCKNCASVLVWHLPIGRLICHHCGKKAVMPAVCPACSGHRLKHFGTGTQAVELELVKLLKENLKPKELPQTARLDSDVSATAGTGTKIYEDWVAGKIQILIGTQIISKGWDVSNVGLIGIISADTTLHLPDFRSNERTFQVLTQVAGRAGRGRDTGSVILQTYHPENYAIKAVRTHNYLEFYQAEIEDRKKFKYPPFVKLVKLKVVHSDQKKAQALALDLFREIADKALFPIEALGPSPAFIPRLRGRYQMQVVLKIPANLEVNLFDFFKQIKTMADIDVDPESLL